MLHLLVIIIENYFKTIVDEKGSVVFKVNFITLFLITTIYSTTLFGDTLQKNLVEVLNTNPVIQERLKNFRAIQQDLNIAESEYYPQIDLRVSGGYNRAGDLKSGDSDFNHNVKEVDYRSYESSLTFTQNLFDGFGTTHKVDFEEARILAAAYKYLEKSNDMAFRMTEAYVNVLKTNELVGTAKENVQINENVYFRVKDLFDAGLTTDSEVKKIQSTLSLARSNLSVQKNNALDAEYSFRRILGRLPEYEKMKKPTLDVDIPRSIESAAMYAIENNPSLLVSRYNILTAESLYKQRKKDFYPKVDLEVSQAFNDHDELNNGFDQASDRFRARIIMNYNLYRGGSDKANLQKHISKMAQEIEIKRDLKRQVIEGSDLSWNAYFMIGEQLKDLREYSRFSEITLKLYKEEYDLGRRSLLDLLSAQNDVINSRSEIIKAEYDQLFAKYRILDAMGLLIVAVNGTSDEFTSKVNLQVDVNAQEVLDTLPFKLDVDDDKVVDNLDLCDNSLKEDNIMPYGCKKVNRDDDNDSIFNEKVVTIAKDAYQKSLLSNSVTNNEIVENELDIPSETLPEGYTVDEEGRPTSLTLLINFQKNSSNLLDDFNEKILEFAEYLNQNPNLKAKIIGHTSRERVSKEAYNITLSKERAKTIKKELIKHGVDKERLSTDGKGFNEPAASNTSPEGRVKNRRVVIEILREDENTLLDSQTSDAIKTESLSEEVKVKEAEKTKELLQDELIDIKKLDTICENPISEGFSLDENGCIVSKTLHVDFTKNSSYIPKDAHGQIKDLFTFLQDNPNIKIKIIGHTSLEGEAKYNKWISKKRAKRLMNALIKEGIEPSRMMSDGVGSEEPITYDMNEMQQMKNRRIEIKILHK